MLRVCIDSGTVESGLLLDLPPGVHIHQPPGVLLYLQPKSNVVEYDQFATTTSHYIPADRMELILTVLARDLPNSWQDSIDMLSGLIDSAQQDGFSISSARSVDQYLAQFNWVKSDGATPVTIMDYIDPANIPITFKADLFWKDFSSFLSTAGFCELAPTQDAQDLASVELPAPCLIDTLMTDPKELSRLVSHLRSADSSVQLRAIQSLMLLSHNNLEGSPALFLAIIDALVPDTVARPGGYIAAVVAQLNLIKDAMQSPLIIELFDVNVINVFKNYMNYKDPNCLFRMPLVVEHFKHQSFQTYFAPTNSRSAFIQMVKAGAPLDMLELAINDGEEFDPKITIPFHQLAAHPQRFFIIQKFGMILDIDATDYTKAPPGERMLEFAQSLEHDGYISKRNFHHLKGRYVTFAIETGNVNQMKKILADPVLRMYLDNRLHVNNTLPISTMIMNGDLEMLTLIFESLDLPCGGGTLADIIFKPACPDTDYISLAASRNQPRILQFLVAKSKQVPGLQKLSTTHLVSIQKAASVGSVACFNILLQEYLDLLKDTLVFLPNIVPPAESRRRDERSIFSICTAFGPQAIADAIMQAAIDHPSIARSILDPSDFHDALNFCIHLDKPEALVSMLAHYRSHPHLHYINPQATEVPFTYAKTLGVEDKIFTMCLNNPSDAKMLLYNQTELEALEVEPRTLLEYIEASRSEALKQSFVAWVCLQGDRDLLSSVLDSDALRPFLSTQEHPLEESPMHLLIMLGHKDCLELLLESMTLSPRGDDLARGIFFPKTNENDFLEIAARYQHQAIVALLLSFSKYPYVVKPKDGDKRALNAAIIG
ncbi:MAG: hypothetical protein O3A01_06655, partial [bacterium]|nr:hypothetical protein [bacterium]